MDIHNSKSKPPVTYFDQTLEQLETLASMHDLLSGNYTLIPETNICIK